jgi:hypothetical protein
MILHKRTSWTESASPQGGVFPHFKSGPHPKCNSRVAAALAHSLILQSPWVCFSALAQLLAYHGWYYVRMQQPSSYAQPCSPAPMTRIEHTLPNTAPHLAARPIKHAASSPSHCLGVILWGVGPGRALAS